MWVGSLGQKVPSKPSFGIPLLLPTSIPGRVCRNIECFSRSPGGLLAAPLGPQWKANTPEPCLAKNSGCHLRYSIAFYSHILLRTEALGGSQGSANLVCSQALWVRREEGGISLVVQWLRHCAVHAGGYGFNPWSGN